ncbi:MAG: exodeoxyribonuclease VII small subunit [Muribaculaceae bacterium]|nr:exodeoxyribonuclease VII small subunit [Muribaculaceae bacterium]
MEEQFSYNKAIAELETILKELQADNCDIDNMVEKTKRASHLIRLCRERLTATDAELKAILDELRPAE